jgi:phosphonate transport system substrate-binding protein
MIRKTTRAWRFAALALLAIGALASPAAQAETFTFTAIPDQDESQLKARFGKVATYLSSALGLDVRYVPVKSYAAAVTAFRNDQVQLAWFGGLSGVRARKLVPGSQALAQGAEDAAFVTYFIAHESAGIAMSDEFPKTIAGKTFTFGEKGSTSGRLMPEFHIREKLGKAPEAAFERVGFSGDHSRTIALVQSGAYQVGALNFAVWERELKEGKIDTSKVHIVWKTPPYPDYQWSIRGDADARFGAGFTDKVRAALLAMKDPDLLAAFPRSGFIPATNADYQPIVDVGREIGLLDE